MDLEQKALAFAREKHDGQLRKDNVTPYITHPIAVVKLLRDIGISDSDIIASGYLHDVVEDCAVSIETIDREFNSEVARIVGVLTRTEYVSREEYKERIRYEDYPVQIVKLADVVHNCSDLTPDLPEKTIQRKVEDCKSLYFDLAQDICPQYYDKLVTYVGPFMDMV